MKALKILVPVWNLLRGTKVGSMLTKNGVSLKMLEKVFKRVYPEIEIIYNAANYSIILDTRDSGIARRYLLNGEHEGFEKQFILKNITFTTFIDIGANAGDWSLFIAANKKDCQVYSFEPHPFIYNRFTRSIELNKFLNIRSFNIAIGSEEAELDLYCDINNQGNNSLISENLESEKKSHRVKIQPFSKYLADINSKNLLIKMDVQGFEYEILKGISREYLLNAHFIIEIDKNTTSSTLQWIIARMNSGRQILKLDELHQQVTEVKDIRKLFDIIQGDDFFDILIQ